MVVTWPRCFGLCNLGDHAVLLQPDLKTSRNFLLLLSKSSLHSTVWLSRLSVNWVLLCFTFSTVCRCQLLALASLLTVSRRTLAIGFCSFIFVVGMLSLRYCWAFLSGWGEQGHSPAAVWWPLLEHVLSDGRLRSYSSWAPWLWPLGAGGWLCRGGAWAQMLLSMAQGVLPDQGSNLFPSLVGRFSTTWPPGMPTLVAFNSLYSFVSQPSHTCVSMHMCMHVHMYACLRKRVHTRCIVPKEPHWQRSLEGYSP